MIKPQQFQAGASINLQTGSGTGDNPINANVPDLDEIAEGERTKVELPKQLEDRCKWLEEKFKAIESADGCYGIDAKGLSLVPDLVLPYKFKMPEFEKYNGTSCAEAYITIFCRRMTGCGKIEARKGTKRPASRRRENEVNNTSTYNKGYSRAITMSQPKATTINHQGPLRQESITRVNNERIQFTPIPKTYRELYQNLFDAHVASPFYLTPLQPTFPKWYDANTQCKYQVGIIGHSIENCTAFKKVVEKLIKIGIVKFDNPPVPNVAGNPLPIHTDQGVNGINEGGGRKVKFEVAEVKIPLRQVWKEMVERGLIILDSEEKTEGKRNHCEFHNREGHEIQECTEFRAIVQNLMDNKEMEFYEEIDGSEGWEVYASDEGSIERVQKGNCPVVIILKPKVNEAGTQVAPQVIIQKPIVFPYRDSKRVPWNYDCNVTIQGKKNSTSASKEYQDTCSHTRSGRRYDLVNTRPIPVKGKTRMVEQEKEKSGEPESLVHELVLNETYVANDISVNKLDRLIGNISADNFIYFNDDEISPGGRGSTKALHITTRCKVYTLPGVLIDNGSALNVLTLSTLNRLLMDSSHMKECQNIVKAFDGTQRRVMGRIEIPLLIGPTTYEVDFLVMNIKPSYNCLLGRPWIHSAGAVPSSLHQKLKLASKGRLVTINAEEDIIAAVTSDAPYLEKNDEAIELSFRSLEFINATFITEGNRISGRVVAPMLKEKQDRFGLRFRPDVKQRKKELEKRQERRMTSLSGEEIKWEPMIIPHISKTFVSGGVIHAEHKASKEEDIMAMLGNVYINAISEEAIEGGSLFLDINDMSDAAIESESLFEQDTCLDGSQDSEDDIDYGLSLDLLKMVKQEERQILPHEETVEVVTLEEGKSVKIGTCITEETNTDIIVHHLPIKEDCKPVQQKIRRMRPDIVLKIKEEVKNQFDAGFLQEVQYLEWVANIVPVPKKDRKVRMCVDYRDLNKASPKDNFPLPHIDTLVDNTVGYSLFSFMYGFLGYNQIKMHSEDVEKTTFITLWGTFCYKVMPFGLKNAGATYQRVVVTLFHDMMHKEIEVYVDDMIATSRTEEEHIRVLRKLFLRLRKFQLKLNPTKCTFRARSGKLLGFVVSKRRIEIDSDKLTEKCDPIFRLLKKHNPGIWDDECQKAFDRVKQYLSNPPVLSPYARIDH
ncbi:RNA-directed DNA polymerase (Reverse transcriptase), Ribonuclease H-like protein [Gossypium australe]|uniref:RNA-directed DNA polymerase (Reverse transcriptase), Ribonuclease H-like protein n=1 Tax=Gossypium australe TaxID=47621 RepID=A0A5B6UH32_9ROSI|nr:RNA-directed DNA polymerase (Reverse transcriptase), Ribonuclease H-like protein [Gossypium australe]